MNINWGKIYTKYAGLWVAMKDDEKTVIGSGKTAKEALKKAQEKGFRNPLLNYVPKKLVHFAGAN
ncbi:hypothetical protein A3C91_03140 [Candidatus Azambacteria bacterium RIFCSPHIGHO2_02_FULL_52_12]|uniref:DUF5678 domain-containing protein n=1 Tax=Candidatus Azambacteria bacterium RIFCSPLOWO2_01_FULL_46_25 TaxID=1797298 RepID=A0A1F5BT83_9BACT|nr:MAG: hypothetical protein A3C91_03140 [Candidatus Azambacteria bacterium RIFCSPHIGHO2_02_FULL_52_12]OGD33827.1 MAG: hypothetical protein A2988_02005 [Candidatus Azambacteria bacterium RIFCSPLOWO2_01_FULL_46_25]OGD36587.1 MAG: hypothetical protein A2850_01670 [Candidatus Azambacteria bacterium RIFCSPHIGHO2_01_FULL_51_74]